MSNGESSGSDKHAALIDYLLEIVGCSRESFGMCTTLRCLKRGGYVKDEQRKPTDPNIATCEVREIIAVLRASLSAVPSNDGLVKELSLYLPDVNGKVHLSTPMMGRVLAALRSAPSAERRGDRFERFHEILTDIEEGRWHGVAGKVQALRDDVCALTPPSSASTSPAGKVAAPRPWPAPPASSERAPKDGHCLICGAPYTKGALGLGPCENGHSVMEEIAQADATVSHERSTDDDAFLRWWHEQEKLGVGWMLDKAFNAPARAALAAWKEAASRSATGGSDT
jgi:hypothetical protein